MHHGDQQDNARPVALVTGAKRGLGKSIAVSLAAAGFDVVVTDLSEDLSDVTRAVGAAGGSAVPLVCDISDVSRIAEKIDEAWSAFGGIDCLVNNAGVAMRPLTDLLDISPEQYDFVMNVNLRGTFFVTQAVAKLMLERGGSPHHQSLVTVSSIAAQMVNLERSPYHLSKTGLAMMNELFAVRLAENGIASYEVRPGYMRTEMTASATPEKLTAQILSGRVPQRRWGTPEDVAMTVTNLAQGMLPFSTGQAVWVDGGLHINRAD